MDEIFSSYLVQLVSTYSIQGMNRFFLLTDTGNTVPSLCTDCSSRDKCSPASQRSLCCTHLCIGCQKRSVCLVAGSQVRSYCMCPQGGTGAWSCPSFSPLDQTKRGLWKFSQSPVYWKMMTRMSFLGPASVYRKKIEPIRIGIGPIKSIQFQQHFIGKTWHLSFSQFASQ